jgi:hypothetical protein
MAAPVRNILDTTSYNMHWLSQDRNVRYAAIMALSLVQVVKFFTETFATLL